jgi:hypothetical protein
MKVVQSVTTPQQAQERHAIMQAPQSHAFPERSVPWQLSINNQISPLQHVIRAQDPPHAHQFSTFIPQDQQQQQQNDSGFASCAGQNFIPPGVGFPQGQALLQQGFVQPCPGQQDPIPPGNFADLSLPQLRGLHAQMRRFVIEGEKNLRTSSATGGEGDIQRQQLRAKLDCYQKRLPVLREIIDSKTRET